MAKESPPGVEELARRANFDEALLALVKPTSSPWQAAERLVEAARGDAAVRLLALALGRREAVWWASQCARRMLADRDPAVERAAVEAAERWASSPTEENRRRAEVAAAEANYGTPGGCAALAAYWSGGSLAPPKLEVVPPPEHLLPVAVANSVILAALKREPEKAAEKYRQFLALAREVAEGKNRWKEEPAAAAARPAPGRR